MENKEEIEKMTFRDYYDQLDDRRKIELRKQIMSESGMSYPTFYHKLAKNKFSLLERNMIAKLCDKSPIELFPE